MSIDRIIGLDLDNTVINYDRALERYATPLIGTDIKGKSMIADAIRQQHGDLEWNRVQGIIYGKGILEAELSPGVNQFMQSCVERGDELYIISHKSRHAKVDPTRTDLRDAALNFLKNKEVLERYVDECNVFFEDDEESKVKMIDAKECDYFVDDLASVLMHPQFPKRTIRIHYSHSKQTDAIYTSSNWDEITNFIMSFKR